MLSEAQRQISKCYCYLECQQHVVILKVKLICKNGLSHYRITKQTSNGQISTISDPRVTSSNLRITSSNPQVTSSNPRVMSSNPRVKSSNPRVTTSNARVRRLKARVEAIKPKVK